MIYYRYAKAVIALLVLLMGLGQTASLMAASKDPAKPNVVLILADDMGYGDSKPFNPDAGISMPHIERLAKEGMRFMDAHSGSGVCTPTRYTLLTGQYAWRTRLKSGVLWGYNEPLIAADRPTLGTLFQKAGYRTAVVGKWHLGMEMQPVEGKQILRDLKIGDGHVNFAKKIENGPTTRGFDYYFGISASLDMPPYFYIENDQFIGQQTDRAGGSVRRRAGPVAEGFIFNQVLREVTNHAIGYIEKQLGHEDPFFLYMPLTSPHKPIVPHPDFKGKSDYGTFGDFLMDTDHTVGMILAAIDKGGIADSTLVIFTSDNGSFATTTRNKNGGVHRSNAHWRGTKADIWEGGSRIPFIVRWPGRVAAGATNHDPVAQVDMFATFADLLKRPLKGDQPVAEDSFTILPLFLGKQRQFERLPIIQHSSQGMFAIRSGKWKLVAGNGSGGRERPFGKAFARPYHLVDLAADPSEKNNLIESHAEKAKELETLLLKIKDAKNTRISLD